MFGKIFAKFNGLLHNLNMEGSPNQTPENSLKNKPNFHEISEKRKELRKAVGELGDKGVILEKHYKNRLRK